MGDTYPRDEIMLHLIERTSLPMGYLTSQLGYDPLSARQTAQDLQNRGLAEYEAGVLRLPQNRERSSTYRSWVAYMSRSMLEGGFPEHIDVLEKEVNYIFGKNHNSRDGNHRRGIFGLFKK